MDRSAQIAKVRLNELLIRWMTLPQTESYLRECVHEATAAATTAPPPPKQEDRDASPPPSPPRPKAIKPEERTPSPLSRFSLGVDEVDMANQRASSPGQASPVSPTALRPAAVDPSLPHPTHLVLEAPHQRPGSSPISPHVPEKKEYPLAHRAANDLGSSMSSLNLSFNSNMVKTAQATPAYATLEDIPPFYRKEGQAPEKPEELDALYDIFAVRRGGRNDIDPAKTVRRPGFSKLCAEVFDVPTVMRDIVFRRVLAASGISTSNTNAGVTYEQVKRYYDIFMNRRSRARRLFELIRSDNRREYLTLDDLKGCARALVEFHPGLTFLSQAEFQDLYCKTVAIRIVHKWERRQSSTVLWPDFERSDVTETLMQIDKLGDINQVLCYFTYEHFYVLYCRFWELDQDRDYLIGLEDMQRYGGGTLSTAALQRIVAGYGRRLVSGTPKKLNFEDFVHFCLCEEDKNQPQSIEYWFRILDLDQDGVLSGFEITQLFNEQRERYLAMGGDELQFEDMLCQMIDMVGAKRLERHRQGFTLADLKACPTAGTFINMLVNAQKFLGFEHRDPFAEFHMKSQPERTDWDRFARIEYDRMASEQQQA